MQPYQRDFLEFGPHYLWPLKMQQIADKVLQGIKDFLNSCKK